MCRAVVLTIKDIVFSSCRHHRRRSCLSSPLTQQVNSLTPTVTKTDRVSAYSESQVDHQQKIAELTLNDRLSASTRKKRRSRICAVALIWVFKTTREF